MKDDQFFFSFRLSFRSWKSASFNSSLRSSHIWLLYIHNFIIILSRVYNEPIQRPAPSWLVSLTGRTLHRYRRSQGFDSRTSLNSFFQAFFFATVKVAYKTAMIRFYLCSKGCVTRGRSLFRPTWVHVPLNRVWYSDSWVLGYNRIENLTI